MVEFMTSYTNPMDHSAAHGHGDDVTDAIPLERFSNIEAPIIPIGELGTTAIDVGQGTNILQNLDKSIRMGTKKIQLVIAGGGQGNPSMLASSYGKEVREEVRAKAKSTGVEITGVELSPGRISSMAGFNQQNHTITEEERQNNLRQVKYAIKFAADIAGGGGVDVWSNEFERTVFDQPWNKGGVGPGGRMFFDNNQEELNDLNKAQLTKYLVDARSGNIVRESLVHTTDKLHIVEYEQAKDRGLAGQKDKSGRVLRADDYIDVEGNYVNRFDPHDVSRLIPKIDQKTKHFEIKTLTWNDIVAETERYNKYYRNGNPELRPEEWAYRLKLLTNISNMRGHQSYYHHSVDIDLQRLREQADEKKFIEDLMKKMTPQEQKKWVQDRVEKMGAQMHGGLPREERERLESMTPVQMIEEEMKRKQIQIQGFQELVTSFRQQEEEMLELWKNVKAPEKYAKEKTFDSYSEAGIHAWKVTREQGLKKPVYVGPEIGWAGKGYGGHPDEFIEIVKESRKQMADKLARQGMDHHAAEEAAKKHIKGMMDTSHLTMWYKHFVAKPGESEEQRLNRFNNWAREQTVKMVKEGVVGGIQLVDSITGEHSHLPAGQGIFEIPKMLQAMKAAGFDGPVVSEGHEEESFQQGRILTETWRAFGSPITSVMPGQPGGTNTWRGIHFGYFGYQMPHSYIVGGYSPSNDWQLWSETPFE